MVTLYTISGTLRTRGYPSHKVVVDAGGAYPQQQSDEMKVGKNWSDVHGIAEAALLMLVNIEEYAEEEYQQEKASSSRGFGIGVVTVGADGVVAEATSSVLVSVACRAASESKVISTFAFCSSNSHHLQVEGTMINRT